MFSPQQQMALLSVKGVLTVTFCNIYMYQVITVYILNLHNVMCQSDINKSGGRKTHC